jgi:glyoxylase-like metal-dependent hydrolase (beta-lactamase superfamily II)
MFRATTVLAAGLFAFNGAACHAESGSGAAFEGETLADGIVLLRPVETSPERTNSLLVEREDGLLVVEAQPTPEAARELLGAVATISSAPIRYLVLSHPHVESWGGASAFPETTLVIAAQRSRELLEDESYDSGAEQRARASNPEEWTAPPKRLPVLLARSPLTLADGRNPVTVAPTVGAHTPADLIVRLEGHRIVYLGPLLFIDRNPFARDGNVGAWLGLLNSISTGETERFVPLVGPVVDRMELRRRRDSLAWVRGQVEMAFVDLVAKDEIPAHILSRPEIGTYFDVDADPSFVSTVVERALAEAVEQRRKRGLK